MTTVSVLSPAAFDVEHPARRPPTVARRERFEARSDQQFGILRVAHPAMMPVLADLALVQKPHRAFAHAVDGPVRVGLAQMRSLRPAGGGDTSGAAPGARHGASSPFGNPKALRAPR